jgi:hypothetical protein
MQNELFSLLQLSLDILKYWSDPQRFNLGILIHTLMVYQSTDVGICSFFSFSSLLSHTNNYILKQSIHFVLEVDWYQNLILVFFFSEEI